MLIIHKSFLFFPFFSSKEVLNSRACPGTWLSSAVLSKFKRNGGRLVDFDFDPSDFVLGDSEIRELCRKKEETKLREELDKNMLDEPDAVSVMGEEDLPVTAELEAEFVEMDVD